MALVERFKTRRFLRPGRHPGLAVLQKGYDSLERVIWEAALSPGSGMPKPPTPSAPAPTSLPFASYKHHIDNLGRLKTVTLNGQQLAEYKYGDTGPGGPLFLNYSNGTQASFKYDAKLRQIGIDVSFTADGTTTSTPITSFHEVELLRSLEGDHCHRRFRPRSEIFN
jgi:hypothetical protein